MKVIKRSLIELAYKRAQKNQSTVKGYSFVDQVRQYLYNRFGMIIGVHTNSENGNNIYKLYSKGSK